MDWTAAHAGFVLASYVLSATCLAALVIYVFARDRRNQKALVQFDRSKP
jgi:heme exporter protein CcmD